MKGDMPRRLSFPRKARRPEPPAFGTMAEWSRRQTRNLVGSALVGSNPAGVDKPPWRNGHRVPPLRERLRVRIPQEVVTLLFVCLFVCFFFSRYKLKMFIHEVLLCLSPCLDAREVQGGRLKFY